MLDYKTIEILSQGFRLTPRIFFYLIFIVVAGIIAAAAIYQESEERGKSILVGIVVSFLCLGLVYFCGGFQEQSTLVKIGVNDVELKTDIYPQTEKYPCLKKENDKVYYFTYINGKHVNNPYKIKEEIQSEFEGIIFNLKNEKQS